MPVNMLFLITGISTHSPRVGRTACKKRQNAVQQHFNSLAPCGANLSCHFSCTNLSKFQLTRPVWGEPQSYINQYLGLSISTHSPRVGRTCGSHVLRQCCNYFNSLAPCGANPFLEIQFATIGIFQLTRPVWGEPELTIPSLRISSDFNSLAPCGANRGILFSTAECMTFQLTRPVWGEPAIFYAFRLCQAFQLTRPVWGEPTSTTTTKGGSGISTHSPRVGRTELTIPSLRISSDFNSLAPCGANRNLE